MARGMHLRDHGLVRDASKDNLLVRMGLGKRIASHLPKRRHFVRHGALKRASEPPVTMMTDDVQDEDSFEPTVPTEEVTGRNPLHRVCQKHPSLDTVEMLCEQNPEYIFEADSVGQTPLHVAAARGACPQVIDYLISQNPRGASTQDKEGKTPLHLACGNRWYSDTGVSRNKVKGPLSSVVRALCESSPSSANQEDSHGKTALEYAIHFEAGSKIVNELQAASKKDWKARKADRRGMSFRRSVSAARVSNVTTMLREFSLRLSDRVTKSNKSGRGSDFGGDISSSCIGNIQTNGVDRAKFFGVDDA